MSLKDCSLTRLIEGTVRKKTFRTMVGTLQKIELKYGTQVRLKVLRT